MRLIFLFGSDGGVGLFFYDGKLEVEFWRVRDRAVPVDVDGLEL